ncbi:hypothetical protein ANN_22296 [Periplaneta americana]|uniref:Uncharacterized protein n=1 Tax=Periplaneta americana TaxID=6978 RepID=A0ABQ8S8P7_PERAM|nr:hypothetical protein ANN_22296 [Periplaneta americana]
MVAVRVVHLADKPEFVSLLHQFLLRRARSRAAQVLYGERYPERNIPNPDTFIAVCQRVRDTGSVVPGYRNRRLLSTVTVSFHLFGARKNGHFARLYGDKLKINGDVFDDCETWTLTLREEQRLRVFENKVLRKIFGARRDEVTGEWRKLHNAELHALYSSPDIIRNIKSRRLRWAGYVARMGESRSAYRVLVGRPEGNRPLGRPRRMWEDNIKMDLREVRYYDREWINLAQDRDRWLSYVRTAKNLRVP